MITRLHYISQGKTAQNHLDNIERMCISGAELIQLRLKDYGPETILETAISAKELCDRFRAKLIVNDYIQVANDIGAYGLHLGKEDCCPIEARELVGDKMIIGGTANTLQDCEVLSQKGVDYIGLGPYRFTSTKKNLSPVLRLKGYQKILEELQRKEIRLPIIAIGGIRLPDISGLLESGVFGVAVSGLLTSDTHPGELINQLNFELNKGNYEYRYIKNSR